MSTHYDKAGKTSWLFTPTGIALCIFLAIAAFFLVTEHGAHLFAVLPYLLLLACPLMHLFMHHGHGGEPSSHDDHNRESQDGPLEGRRPR